MTQDAEAQDAEMPVCENCEEKRGHTKRADDPVCHRCYRKQFYPASEGVPQIPTMEEVVTDESPINTSDFVRLRNEENARFRISFDEVAEVADVSSTGVVHIELDMDSRPPMLILEEVTEDDLSLPTTRRVSDTNGGTRVAIPPKYIRDSEPHGLSLEIKEYSNDNALLLWPQVFDGTIFFFVFAFESEIEAARADLADDGTGEDESVEDGPQAAEDDTEATEEEPDETVQQELTEVDADQEPGDVPDHPVAGISPHSMEVAVEETGVAVGELVEALEKVAQLNPETVDPHVEHGVEDLDGINLYVVAQGTWEKDCPLWAENGLDTLPTTVLAACQLAHSEEARNRSEAEPGYETFRMVAEAIILPDP
jgi:hypothetical protein